MDFTTSIPEEWKVVLSAKSIEQIEHIQNRVLFAILDINAYYYAIEENKEAYKKWIAPLFRKETVNNLFDTRIDYFHQSISLDLFLDKTTFDFYNAVHSFFDVFGQFIACTIYPNRIDLTNSYISGIFVELQKEQKYSNITSTMNQYFINPVYQYIIDFNNISKHRNTLSPLVTTWLNNGDVDSHLPEFAKGNRTHANADTEDAFENALDLITEFYYCVTQEIITYLYSIR